MSIIHASTSTVTRLGDAAPQPATASDTLADKRRLVAELCQFMGAQLTGRPRSEAIKPAPANQQVDVGPLSPRVRQTLDRMLAGDSEKQIATHLGVSPHTVHVYVKRLYRHFDVCTRGELLARFVGAVTKP